MQGLKVRLIDLKQILIANRGHHRDEFDKALIGYREYLLKYLEEQIDRVKNNKQAIRIHVDLPVPEDHTSDYDRVLRMVDLAIAAEQVDIELDEHDAAQYIMDDWNWKRAFATTTAFYASAG